MAVSTALRQLLAILAGFLGWWYFFTAEPVQIHPQWVGVVLAAFLISLIMAIISENIVVGPIIILAIYLFYGPGLTVSITHLLPMLGGMAAAAAFWKII